MENDVQKELENLTKIVKEQSKLIKRVAKALHLLPVTEKEEKELQIMQRRNFSQAEKVNDDLNQMENKDLLQDVGIGNLFSSVDNVYSDVLGEDILGGNH